MEKELSITEINNQVNSVKNAIISLCDKDTFIVRIDWLNIRNGGDYKLYKKIKRGDFQDLDSFVKAYTDTVNSLLSDVDVLSLKVYLGSTNGKIKSTYQINAKRSIPDVVMIPSQQHQEETQDRTQNQQQFTQQQGQGMGDMANDFLKLLGFDANSALDGFENKQLGGLGAIMAVREQNLRKEFAIQKQQDKYEALIIEKAKLEEELKSVRKELSEEQKYVEKLEDQLEQLEEEKNELEKLKPEYSLAGVSLVGVGAKIVENLAKKHASFVGGLAGMNAEDFTKMLDADNAAAQQSAIATQQVNDIEIEAVADDERSKKIAEICKFLKSLSDTDFEYIWQIMSAFYKDSSLISQFLTALTQSQENYGE